MPYVINWPHKRGIALAAASLTLLVAASPAAAFGGFNNSPYSQPQLSAPNSNTSPYSQPQPSAPNSNSSPYAQYQPSAPNSSSCPASPSASVFSALGDSASYSLLPGGDFSGNPLAAGWVFNGASVVPGGEPWNVSGDANQSLNISSGGYAVSPTFCLTSLFPTWRFFALAADGGPNTQLKVTALYADIYGNSGQMTATTLSGSGFTSWQPTSTLPLGSEVPSGDVANVRFVFTPNSGGGAWNIDDVYIDPYAR